MTEGNKKMLKIFSGLGLLFSFLLVALGFKIYYALATHQPVLAKDYYDTGRMYDKYVRAHANTKNRRLVSPMFEAVRYPHIPVKGYLKQGANRITVRYLDDAGRGVSKAQVLLHLGRRATNTHDFEVRCSTDDAGRCSLQFDLPYKGFWEGSLSATDASGRYTMRGSFLAD